jgi:hypothetical protein
MPLPAGDAIVRRDDTLARTRRASRWITTAAIATAVTLGAAFAHALPGHHATAQAATATGRAGGSGPQGASQRPRRSRHQHGAGHHHKSRHHLAPPPRPPASSQAPQPTSTPTPPPVVSGGS